MRQGPLTSPALARAWQRGDESAVRAVFDVCYPLAVRLGILSGLGTDRAQDCAQDAFVLAFERRAQLRDPAAFTVWFHRIATRRVLDALTAPSQADSSLPEDGDLVEDWSRNQAPMPEDLALAHERRDAMWREVERLPPGYRVPLVLRYYHGFTTGEIADIMGVSPGALRVTLHRAIGRLRQSVLTEGSRERSYPAR